MNKKAQQLLADLRKEIESLTPQNAYTAVAQGACSTIADNLQWHAEAAAAPPKTAGPAPAPAKP